MFSERSSVRLILGLLTSIAVASAAQLEASEPAFCQTRSMRRANRMARRGPTGRYCSQVHAEMSVVAPGPAKELKQASDLEGGGTVQVTGDVRAVSQSSNQFAFELYRRPNEQQANMFFSPASISTALAMAHVGAKGGTKQQMAQVLHFDLPDPRLHDGFGMLNAILNTKSKSYQLHLANRLWAQNGFHFEPPFLKSTLQHYGAEPGPVDFARTEQARQTINHWVEEKTSGKIAGLIPPGVLHEKIRLVLTNAIYFKGTWQYRFSKTDTREAPFHVLKDREMKVQMMTQTGGFQYAATADTQLLELPYVGRDLSMVILLPKQVDGLPKLEKKLTANDVQKWISGLEHAHEVEVYLPKFTFTSQIGLKEALSSMGMPLAFSDQADFSGISTEKRQKLFEVIHQAFIDVNEEGTEAAAVTAGVGGNAPGPVFERVVFRADHPFLFLIQDTRTGAILFLGRLINPNG
jgi:serpin B